MEKLHEENVATHNVRELWAIIRTRDEQVRAVPQGTCNANQIPKQQLLEVKTKSKTLELFNTIWNSR